MTSSLQDKLNDVVDAARRHRVQRLSLFGSAARSDFKPGQSDIDFLVEFLPLPPAEYAQEYFALQEELESLLGVPVDLVERAPIRNRRLLEAIERSKAVLYEAA